MSKDYKLSRTCHPDKEKNLPSDGRVESANERYQEWNSIFEARMAARLAASSPLSSYDNTTLNLKKIEKNPDSQSVLVERGPSYENPWCRPASLDIHHECSIECMPVAQEQTTNENHWPKCSSEKPPSSQTSACSTSKLSSRPPTSIFHGIPAGYDKSSICDIPIPEIFQDKDLANPPTKPFRKRCYPPIKPSQKVASRWKLPCKTVNVTQRRFWMIWLIEANREKNERLQRQRNLEISSHYEAALKTQNDSSRHEENGEISASINPQSEAIEVDMNSMDCETPISGSLSVKNNSMHLTEIENNKNMSVSVQHTNDSFWSRYSSMDTSAPQASTLLESTLQPSTSSVHGEPTGSDELRICDIPLPSEPDLGSSSHNELGSKSRNDSSRDKENEEISTSNNPKSNDPELAINSKNCEAPIPEILSIKPDSLNSTELGNNKTNLNDPVQHTNDSFCSRDPSVNTSSPQESTLSTTESASQPFTASVHGKLPGSDELRICDIPLPPERNLEVSSHYEAALKTQNDSDHHEENGEISTSINPKSADLEEDMNSMDCETPISGSLSVKNNSMHLTEIENKENSLNDPVQHTNDSSWSKYPSVNTPSPQPSTLLESTPQTATPPVHEKPTGSDESRICDIPLQGSVSNQDLANPQIEPCPKRSFPLIDSSEDDNGEISASINLKSVDLEGDMNSGNCESPASGILSAKQNSLNSTELEENKANLIDPIGHTNENSWIGWSNGKLSAPQASTFLESTSQPSTSSVHGKPTGPDKLRICDIPLTGFASNQDLANPQTEPCPKRSFPLINSSEPLLEDIQEKQDERERPDNVPDHSNIETERKDVILLDATMEPFSAEVVLSGIKFELKTFRVYTKEPRKKIHQIRNPEFGSEMPDYIMDQRDLNWRFHYPNIIFATKKLAEVELVHIINLASFHEKIVLEHVDLDSYADYTETEVIFITDLMYQSYKMKPSAASFIKELVSEGKIGHRIEARRVWRNGSPKPDEREFYEHEYTFDFLPGYNYNVLAFDDVELVNQDPLRYVGAYFDSMTKDFDSEMCKPPVQNINRVPKFIFI